MARVEVFPQDQYNEALLSHVHPPGWENPVPDGRYNLVVIGAGSAGLVTAAGAAGLGAKVALVERGLLGGDCLNVGCVPSKSLIRPARAIGEIRRAQRLGVQVPAGTTADFAAVMERMRKVRATIAPHDSAQRFQDLGVDVFLGEARFSGTGSVAVAGQTLEFKKAVIASGSRPAVPPIPGLQEAGYLTNETVFELVQRPRRLAVIGGGPVGVELAQAFQRLGSSVFLFERLAQVLAREDAEAAAIIHNRLAREGVALYLPATVRRVERQAAAKAILFEHAGEEQQVLVDEILVAAGRKSNVEDLNLEAAAVEYNEAGLVVNGRLQTTNPAIYAAGDVTVPYAFTHVADATARMVIQNALFLGRKRVEDLVVPRVTYTDPEVAHVGNYFDEQEGEVDTYKIELAETDRGRTDGVEEGFVKVYTRKGSDKIVGATIVGPHAGEMISEVTLAMVAGAGLKTLTTVIHPYPTLAEAIRKTADAYNRTRLTPLVQKIFNAWLRLTR